MSQNKSLPKNYETAFSELQTITQRFENEDISIDELSSLVSRAAFLLNYCQERLRTTENDVKNILSKMENAEDSSS
jgi:exodeoxyribonuclease VII small subunit